MYEIRIRNRNNGRIFICRPSHSPLGPVAAIEVAVTDGFGEMV